MQGGEGLPPWGGGGLHYVLTRSKQRECESLSRQRAPTLNVAGSSFIGQVLCTLPLITALLAWQTESFTIYVGSGPLPQ